MEFVACQKQSWLHSVPIEAEMHMQNNYFAEAGFGKLSPNSFLRDAQLHRTNQIL